MNKEQTEQGKHNRKKIIKWIIASLVVLSIIIVLLLYFIHKGNNGGGSGGGCDGLQKLDYKKFTDNANNFAKQLKLPERVLDGTNPDKRYLIINNKCDYPVIMSDIGYHDKDATKLSLLQKPDFFTDPDGVLRAYGGVYIPKGQVIVSETPEQELYSGRIWPRINCKSCPIPKGVQHNMCSWASPSLSSYCPCPLNEGFISNNDVQIVPQTPDQSYIKNNFPVGSSEFCNAGATLCNNPLYHLQCEVGSVPYGCNSADDCGYIGTIKNPTPQTGLNTGWGLGAIGMSGKGPTIPLEYTLKMILITMICP